MNLLITKGWSEYELLDSGEGQRLERFGKYIISRPDPQIIWNKQKPSSTWSSADAVFQKSTLGQDKWVINNPVPKQWLLSYKDLAFWARLTPFKHTGVFPEQHLHWDWIRQQIVKSDEKLNILNLFAYTGIASLAAAKEDAKVTHLDASKPAIAWAKENQQASGLAEDSIRWILDDALKFVEREIRRENKYDGIIMDPPVFGHDPEGKAWKFNNHFPLLLKTTKQILVDKPKFILINAYAISSSALMLENMLKDLDLNGKTECGELALQETDSDRLLSTGIFGRFSS